MKISKIFFCIPTFKEPDKVKLFLNSLLNIKYENIEIVIVNANGIDKTSDLISNSSISKKIKITELYGLKTEMWSSTLNRALVYSLKNSKGNDFVLISNIDIEFKDDIASLLIKKSKQLNNSQVGAISIYKNNIISSGVKVNSWFWTLNEHPFAGLDKSTNIKEVREVDYLPGRCFIFPISYLKLAGLINSKYLPHYHADYEFSWRLSKFNCKAYIDPKSKIYVDMNNTGKSIFDSKTNFYMRLKNSISIKSPSNPYYRVIMVIKMFPLYAIPSGVSLYLLRSFVELVFGGITLRKLFNKNEKGFSGTNL